MDKIGLRTEMLDSLFKNRRRKAEEEYNNSVKGTPYEDMPVSYRNKVLSTSTKRRKNRSEIYNVPEDSEHAKKLDRLIRVIEDVDVATRQLTYILNSVDTTPEYEYLMGIEHVLEPTIRTKLDMFKEVNKTRFQTLNKFKLLADMV